MGVSVLYDQATYKGNTYKKVTTHLDSESVAGPTPYRKQLIEEKRQKRRGGGNNNNNNNKLLPTA